MRYDKQKILIVLYYYHPYVSGLSLLAKMLAEGMVARGHDVTVLTTRYDASLKRREIYNGVEIFRAKVLAKFNKGVVSPQLMRKMIELAETHDVINPHLPMAHIGFVLPFIDTKKLFPQYHCDLNLGHGALAGFCQRFAYWSMAWTLQKSAKIIVTSKDYFSNCHFSGFSARAREIYPPIDQGRFVVKDSTEMRATLGLGTNTKLIGFVGRIVEEKGLEYLLRAIPLLEQKLDDFQVVIAGEYENIAGGSVKDKIDIEIDRHRGRVKLLGHLKFDDLVVFYNMIDVLVLPSVDPLEAFGMVQVEAMLCGTPVIASDMPGVREVISQTGYGRLARKRDPEDIADKISDLLEHPVAIHRSKLDDFDFERTLDKYEALFSNKDAH
jgi:glycosyltransferase involved in cell wall biosynthesis